MNPAESGWVVGLTGLPAGHNGSTVPTYEYLCKECGHQWEAEQRISADPLKDCPSCGKPAASRQISAGNFILKGGGWYADLYSSSSKPKADTKASDAKSESKTETKSESKTETKSETKTEAKVEAKPATNPPPKSSS